MGLTDAVSAPGPLRRLRDAIKRENSDSNEELGIERKTLMHGGIERSYWIHIPDPHEVSPGVPLVIVIHGGGGSGEQAAKQYGWIEKSDEAGFIAVFPNGSGRMGDKLLTWNAGNCCGYALDEGVDDVGFLRAMIADLEAVYKINPRRIYATGMSNGGMMSYRLACELSDKLAAVGPVAGALNIEPCEPKHPVSVIAVHGTEDASVRYEGGKPEKKADWHDRTDTSVAESTGFWIRYNECAKPQTVEETGNIRIETWGGGRNGTEVKLISVVGGTHAWPGGARGARFLEEPSQEISATKEIWKFFDAHPRQE